jgi:hypothetical protein
MMTLNPHSYLHIRTVWVNRFLAIGLAVSLFPALSGCRKPVKLHPAQVSGFNDEFDGAKNASPWLQFKQQTFEQARSGGELRIIPNQHVVWWKADSGPMLYKRVKGNFRVSTRVRARSKKSPDRPPNSEYQFGGLIARSPGSDETGRENYVFSVVGYRGKYLSVETKTTRNDESEVEGPTWDSGDAELRICRINSTFVLLNRKIGSKEWKKAITYERRDLPPTLQVGPIAYSYAWKKVDLLARFEYVRYSPVTAMKDCFAD